MKRKCNREHEGWILNKMKMILHRRNRKEGYMTRVRRDYVESTRDWTLKAKK